MQEESSVYKKAIGKDLAKLSLERDKDADDKMEETSSPGNEKIFQEESSVYKKAIIDKDEKGRKEDNLKSREEIESLSSLEDNSVIRGEVPSETFSPSKASLSLKQCVNIIREQLHIQDTSVGAVIRLALEEFDTLLS